jgi:hypothetical protein
LDYPPELPEKLNEQEWRLDNLYRIVADDGAVIPFVRNEAQRTYWANRWHFNVILKARQLGFSTLIALVELDTCLFKPNTTAGIVDYALAEAKKKLAKIKFAYDGIPEYLRDAIPLIRQNSEALEFGNGSVINVGTSHRGGTLQILHVSEYGKISAERPEKAREIKTGAFGTVHHGQFIHVESTAEGTGGEFYELVQRAEAAQKEGRELTELDFRLHFFPWWKHPHYRLTPQGAYLTAEVTEYFAEIEQKAGIKLSGEQKAWYAAKLRQVGPDDIKSEYPSTSDECFHTSIEGAYFKREMAKARSDGRIGVMPHDESKNVNTFWDIGRDTTSIWFHQTDGMRHRLIDYYENSGEQIAHYVRVIQQKKDQRGFLYGKHLGPHDFGVIDWGGEGRTRQERAKSLGVEIEVIPRVEDKADAIEEARTFLNNCWIDTQHCARGIECLDNYRKQWDERRSTWKDDPFHDWASHGSDSLMTGAMGFVPESVKRDSYVDRHRRRKDSMRSAWSA